MNVQHFDPEKLVQAYNVDLQMLYPWDGVVEPPFGAAWAVLAPGESTKPHQHQENETFFVVRGQGTMTVGEESRVVTPGSVMYHSPFHQHTLTNTSDDEDLMFLTVWWEDRDQWPEQHPEDAAAAERQGPILVTAAPPTPNGDMHLGHLAGPYLSADFYTRYARLRGRQAAYACGSDDHCMYVQAKGRQMGLDGWQAADHFVAAITESLESAGLDLAVFMRPAQSEHFEPMVQDLFAKLQAAGQLERRRQPCLYSEQLDRYLFEADVSGRCPHCDHGMVGITCEECGRICDATELVEPRCTHTGETPVERPCTRLVFPLSRWAEPLRAYLQKATMPGRLRAFCEKQLADGLPDVPISHVSDWGIPVPVEDPELAGQTLYVWFEMAARYLAYAQHVAEGQGEEEGYGHYWRRKDASIVQFFGFDNSFWYTLMLPALYMAYDPTLRLPTAFVTNEFYRLEGQKFSTSRGHAILGRSLLAAAPRDAVRFYLAYSCPERTQESFTVAEFEATVERELVGRWQPWLGGLVAKVHTEFDAEVPATGDWTAEQLAFQRRLERLAEDVVEAYEPAGFSPQRITRLACDLVRSAERFGAGQEPWKTVPERSQERRSAVALELLAAKLLALVTAPVMPEFADRLWADLGYGSESTMTRAWQDLFAWVPAGQRLAEPSGPYFSSVVGSLAETAETRARG